MTGDILYSAGYAVAGWMLRDQPSLLTERLPGGRLAAASAEGGYGHREAAPDQGL